MHVCAYALEDNDSLLIENVVTKNNAAHCRVNLHELLYVVVTV